MKNILAAAFLGLMVLPAQASTITLVITGTVESQRYRDFPNIDANWANGMDNAGLFGPAGASLQDIPFAVTWVGDCLINGCLSATLVSASIEINGFSQNFGTNGFFESSQSVNNYPVQLSLDTRSVTNYTCSRFSCFGDNIGSGIPLDSIWGYTLNPSTDNINEEDGIGGSFFIPGGNGGAPYAASGYLHVETLSLNGGSVVPAPLLGAGLPGIVLLMLALIARRSSRPSPARPNRPRQGYSSADIE